MSHKSSKSLPDQPSVSGRSSSLSVDIALKHAKAEAAKAKLQYAVHEAELRKRQAIILEKQKISEAENVRIQDEIGADLQLIQTQKEVAETTAEINALKSASVLIVSGNDFDGRSNINLPQETPGDRTERYVQEIDSIKKDEHSELLKTNIDQAAYTSPPRHYDNYDSTPPIENQHMNLPLPSYASPPLPQLPVTINSFPGWQDTTLSATAPPFQPVGYPTYFNPHPVNSFIQHTPGNNFAPHPPSNNISQHSSGNNFFPRAVNDFPQNPSVGYFNASLPGELTQFLLKKELLLTRITNFNDQPEAYAMWKAGFLSVMKQLNVTVTEELDLLVKWLGPDSARHAVSLRAANVNNPTKGLQRIWERLEERYGCPEMIEAAIKAKLDMFPKLSNKDNKKLFELSDILCEIESLKEDAKYQTLLGYFDTSSGVNLIVNKLPYNLQDKWTNQAARYKREHNVPFPPFWVFVDFVKELSQIRNDPSFCYENNTTNVQRRDKPLTSLNFTKTHFATKKTDINSTNTEELCPLHKTYHSLNQCRDFRYKSLEERRNFIKEHNICFKCCESSEHGSRTCDATVLCVICKSDRHPSALHVFNKANSYSPPSPPVKKDSGEPDISDSLTVNPKCTQICHGEFQGKSCSKTILANVYPSDQPENSIRAYVILDDQSNVSLAKSNLFDIFNENGMNVPYALSSCSGLTQTSGRRAQRYTIQSLDGHNQLFVPSLIECNEIPNAREEIPTPNVAFHHSHLKDISKHIPEIDNNAEILILIGRDIPEAHHVLEQRTGGPKSPYAQRLSLGWVVIGETCLGKVHQPIVAAVKKTHILSNRRPSFFPPCTSNLNVKELIPQGTSHSVSGQSIYSDGIGSTIYVTTSNDNKPGWSREDREFVTIMDNEVFKNSEGHWVAPLPFKSNRQRLPNNQQQALKRAHNLHSSLMKDPKKKEHFMNFMRQILDNNHAEVAPKLQQHKERWYLPLFGVYHPQKPEQILGVFDSSAQYNGISLNDVLLKGPDLTNSLLGVLLRFRRETIAVTADIQSMFHCFHVREDHRDFLRFFWYANNNMTQDLIEYRMRVHVFGNKPSPSVASYCLLKTAHEVKEVYGEDVVSFVEKDFYVDDGLTSLSSVDAAIDLFKRTQQALSVSGNLRLHKIASNSGQVMEAFPDEDQAKGLKNLNFEKDNIPLQRSLGLAWDVQTDTFTFQVPPDEKPYTRRGVLSTISSLFDPIGFVAPVIIKGKILLRELMTETTDWDAPLSSSRQREWEDWKTSLKDLENLQIPRTYLPVSISTVGELEVLIFCDASEKAISAVAYLRASTGDGTQNTGFIFGKAKVAPAHGHTIPRLELCGAVLAIEIAETISEHLNIPLTSFKFFTDSKVVLGYLHNQSRRFYVYVSNRVDRIRASSNPEQWQYVPTQANPADLGTRAILASELSSCAWLSGPENAINKDFLPTFPLHNPELDGEVRPEVAAKVTHVNKPCLPRFNKCSSWSRLVGAYARLRHIAATFRGKTPCKGWHYCKQPKSVEHFTDTEQWIITQVQKNAYSAELDSLRNNKPLPQNSPILNLNPKIDECDILRVGGRLNKSDMSQQTRNPLIIPGKDHIATLLIRHHHEKVKHQGRLFTEGAVRSAGLWITGCKHLISSILHKCTRCRKLRGQPQTQIMSDLPADRLTPSPAFTYVGIDAFGPWSITSRRTRGGSANSKRWAILFSCLVTRAIHIEVIEQMSSSSFINALRRFQSIRGKVKQYRSDRGTNFVGAIDDIHANAINVEDDSVGSFLYNSGVRWLFNPPHSSHMGGCWERMIGITRRILDSMLSEVSSSNLTHEVLQTFMCEVCAIVNNRPIIPVSSDPEDPYLLTPNTLLTGKTDRPVEPLEHSDLRDLYRKQWKQVQVLAEQFWKQWQERYLHTLQSRRKWLQEKPNLQTGDVVLLKQKDTQRNEWPLGIVQHAIRGEDDNVRKAVVKVTKDNKPVCYTRPISEIILLLSSE